MPILITVRSPNIQASNVSASVLLRQPRSLCKCAAPVLYCDLQLYSVRGKQVISFKEVKPRTMHITASSSKHTHTVRVRCAASSCFFPLLPCMCSAGVSLFVVLRSSCSSWGRPGRPISGRGDDGRDGGSEQGRPTPKPKPPHKAQLTTLLTCTK
jgi:hypothetical protein